MKHNLLKSVILSVILLMGVSNAWAANLYLLPNSNWKSDNARFAAYFFGNGEKWVSMSNTVTVAGTTYYKVEVPSGYTKVIFCRMNPSNSTNDWNNKWNQTGDLTIPTDGKNLFDKDNGTWDGATNTWKNIELTITYKDQGNTNFSGTHATGYPTKHIYDGGGTTLKSATKTGYTFGGWHKEQACTNKLTSLGATTYTANITLYAKWTANTYTVAFNANGGTGTMSNQNFTYGTAQNLTANIFSRTGYTFAGWNTKADGTGTNYNDKASVNNLTSTNGATVTLYAKWTANKYTINYKDKGDATFSGTHASGYPTQHTYGTPTTLKTASKTGYTFDGWFTTQDCSGTAVTTLGATAYTAAITLYAKWTEKPKYTVTITTDGNGTVSPNTPQQVGEIPVSITATPNDGYKFKNWTKTGSVTIANANNASTTITATGTGTVTANFDKINRIYLKPAGDNSWADGSPRYAVYVIDDQTWHNMTKINDGDGDAGNDIYYCEIKPTYQKVIFCRMNPGNATNDWGNRWTQTEDLTLPDNCNMFDIEKDASTENYVNANGTWMEYNAWHLAGDFNSWVLCGQTLQEQEDGSFTFTTHLEKDHTYEFKLVHNGEWYGNDGTMVRGTSSGWTMSTSANNCKITVDYTGNYTFTFDASTKKQTVQYPILITLKSSMFGPYGISYNGQSYYSHKNEDVIVNVPYGASINFLEGQPYSNIYTGDIMQSAPAADKQRKIDLNQSQTVLGDMTFESNYVTKVPQTIYLGVPNSSTWNNSGNANLIWRYDSYDSFMMYDNLDKGEFEFEANGVKYYKFTLQPGCNKFKFQRKDESTHQDFHNASTTYAETLFYLYEVLNTDVNCYMLDGGMYDGKHTGYWCTLPPRDGDYRLLYVEQVVEKDANGNTVVARKKAHPSDVVKAGEITASGKIVSLHIYKERTYEAKLGGGNTYTSSNNPEVILQRYDGSKWVDEECHMVFGPLETLPSMGMLPGRKNASVGSDKDDFVYDNGIDIIKNDTHEDQGSGVWNFYIVKNGSTVTLDLNRTHRYTGDYYIRTNAAFGEWNSYKGSDNHMTRSDVSKHHSNYSHYYCKWVETVGTNVKFTIANDYGMAISDTLVADSTTLWGELLADADKMVTGETLPDKANVRFAWNEKTNFLHRAYLGGSTDVASRFLVLEGKTNQLYNAEGNALAAGVDNGTDPRYGLKANEEIFNDISNWVYYTDVQMIPNADLKVTAQYTNGTELKVQYFVGQAGDNYNNTILAGTGTQKYLIRLLYDFKTNELISAYVPGGQAGTEIEAIETNLMLIRKENDVPRQLNFNTNNMKDVGKQAYGVLELTQKTLEDNEKNIYVRSLYWISFPFDVRITDIFGFGEYGKHWIIQSYDGQKRADNGLWLESETNWVYHFDPNTLNAGTQDQGIMKRGVGYVVALDLDQIKADNKFVGRINTIALYFPSTNTITGHIDNETSVTIDVPEHVCTINRNTPKGDRRVKDSHWNVIGVPSYINAVGNFGNIDGKFNHIELENRPQQLQFYYEWLGDYDQYKIATPSPTENFNSLTAYMVQYAGDLTWTSVLNEGPASLAAKRNSDDMEQHHLRLELQQNGTEQDRTFIQLQEDEVTAGFDFNYDLCKINNSGANIYSLIATDRDPIEVAGNVLPVEEAIIPLGIKLDAAGEYTFSMPQGTDNIVVELIDYENNTRTNMLLDDYTVDLGKGTFETRFALHVKPDKTVTGLEEVNTNTNGVKKYLINGILYMQKDGALYDAQGKLVR